MDISNAKIEFPSHTLILGRTQSGKTTLLMNVMYQYIDKFDYIVLMSGSYKVHNQYDMLAVKPLCKYNNIDVDAIEIILKHQKNFAEQTKLGKLSRKVSCLIIMDDTGQFSFYRQNNSKHGTGSIQLFKELFLNGRQYNISVIILSQCESGLIPPGLVQNCSTVMITSANNALVEKVYKSTKERSMADFKEHMFKECREKDQAVIIRSDWMECPTYVKYHDLKNIPTERPIIIDTGELTLV